MSENIPGAKKNNQFPSICNTESAVTWLPRDTVLLVILSLSCIFFPFFWNRDEVHIEKWAILKWTVHWHLVILFHYLVQLSSLSSPKAFSSPPNITLYPSNCWPHSSQALTTTNLFSLSIYLFFIFYIDRIILYMTFCVWLLSLSIKFLRFIHTGACISTAFFMAE